MKEKSDEELARMTQEKNKEAFCVLVERYEIKLLRYGKRFLFDYDNVKDAVQDVFIKTYENINSFNVNKKFSPWIYRIAHNNFVNIIKKEKRESYGYFNTDEIFSFNNEEITTRLDKEKEKEKINKSLNLLKPKYREPIILYYFEDKDYKEISDILKIPVSTVGVRLKRGRENIKKNYEKK